MSNAEIEKLKEDVSANMSEIKIQVALINQKLDMITTLAKRTDEVIYGNGKIGLRTQVYILWGVFLVISSLLVKKMMQ